MFDRRYLPTADHEFVVITDTHYMLDVGDAPLEFESRRKQTARAGVALSLVAALDVDHVVHLGDLNQEYPETPGFDQAQTEALAQIRDLGLSPYFVPGNHDVGDKPDPTMPTHDVSAETLAKFNERIGPTWQRVDIGPHRLLLINSQILNTDLSEATEQRAWLEAQLTEAVAGSTFLFLHLPPYLYDGTEQGFGHYDVIDEPDRSWLLDLIRNSDVDTVAAAHVHFAFADRIGSAHYRVLASPSFVRPGFSHLFTSAAPPERGRDDTSKFGFTLVRIAGDRTDLHTIRTGGAQQVDPRTRLLTRTSAALPTSPIGVTFREAVSPVGRVPIAWPSVIVQPVRNDYPLLSCLEMGITHVRVPATEMMDERQLGRIALLRDHGVTVTAFHLFAYPSAATEMAGRLRNRVDGLEIQFAAEYADDFAKATSSDLSLTLAPITTGVVIAGKQHPRTRVGYSLDEATDPGDSRALCRVAPGDRLDKWLTTRAVTSGRADLVLDLPGEDDTINATRVAHGLLGAATAPGTRLFIDPLADLDRTIDVMHGLIDTRCNPRPAMTVVRMLNTILFANNEAWTLESTDPWTLSSPRRRLTLSENGHPEETQSLYGLTTGTVTNAGENLDDPILLLEFIQ